MGVRHRFLRGLATQLGRPEGLRGRLVARGLNRGNRASVEAAVEACALQPGQVAADIGFGGGLGLPLLLDRVRPGGQVHGVELSDTMLHRAQRQYRDPVSAGSLTLHAGSLTALPLADDSIHGTITVNTIYFVADLASAFAELARVVQAGGRTVVGLGDPDAMANLPFTAHGFRLRPVDEVEATLLGAGFAAVDHQRVGDGPAAYHLLAATMGRAS